MRFSDFRWPIFSSTTGKVLPIRILDPKNLHVFVADVEGVLEIAEAYEQSDGGARPAGLGIKRLEFIFESLPVDFVSHLKQWMVLVEHLLKVSLEKVKLIFEWIWFWFHFRPEIAMFCSFIREYLAILYRTQTTIALKNRISNNFFRDD